MEALLARCCTEASSSVNSDSLSHIVFPVVLIKRMIQLLRKGIKQSPKTAEGFSSIWQSSTTSSGGLQER